MSSRRCHNKRMDCTKGTFLQIIRADTWQGTNQKEHTPYFSFRNIRLAWETYPKLRVERQVINISHRDTAYVCSRSMKGDAREMLSISAMLSVQFKLMCIYGFCLHNSAKLRCEFYFIFRTGTCTTS
jgi:hypothetical protein